METRRVNDTNVDPQSGAENGQPRVRKRTLFIAVAVALVVGVLVGQPAISWAASTLSVKVKNWPKMPWKVAVVQEPSRTVVSTRTEYTVAQFSSATNGDVYVVPAGKWLTVTQVSFTSETANTDGRTVFATLREGSSGFPLAIPVTNVVNWTALGVNQCSTTFNTEWHVAPGTPITYDVIRDAPRNSQANGEIGMNGYLTGAP